MPIAYEVEKLAVLDIRTCDFRKVFKAWIRLNLVVDIDASDEENIVLLREGYIPDIPSQRKVFPNHFWLYRGLSFDDLGFKSADESAAWMMSALTRKRAASSPYLSDEDISKIPFDTWVIGYPSRKDSRLADWFRGESQQTNYRLIIHRAPRYFEGESKDVAVGAGAFREMQQLQSARRRGKHLFDIQRRGGSYGHLKPGAEAFLHEVLAAYREGRPELTLQRSGHPYCFSDGRPPKSLA